ncbi:MAG TPA: YihA family ribosome biogenesis GTP-binding protein, partial [Caldithrix abyssi]|nr:YihA family ribosome biogenesis GTP-binding protein [Caldithrix abyssi]
MINFHNVQFIKSLINLEHRPQPELMEICFIGRSNVGKSSLLNALFGTRKLVKVSSTPGKTQLVNYFMVDNRFYCVDLPGYGFARLPKKEQVKWQKMIEGYLLGNDCLKKIYLLLDARHELQTIDRQMIEWLNHYGLDYSIILSKCDKISKNALN